MGPFEKVDKIDEDTSCCLISLKLLLEAGIQESSGFKEIPLAVRAKMIIKPLNLCSGEGVSEYILLEWT